MTSPTPTTANTGQVDNTPTVGGSESYAASGARGAVWEDAPDAKNDTVHRPGDVPGVSITSGPAAMTVGGGRKRKRK